MSTLWRKAVRFKIISRQLAAVIVGLLLAAPAYAQGTLRTELPIDL